MHASPTPGFEPKSQLQKLVATQYRAPFSALAPLPENAGAARQSAVLLLFSANTADGSVNSLDDLNILLTQRSPRMRYHPGQISFPGGGLEAADADHIAAALRETAEETGVDPQTIEVYGSIPALHILASNNLVTPVIGWWDAPHALAADATETVSVFQTALQTLADPQNRGTLTLRTDKGSVSTPAFELRAPHGKHLCWGFTAMVLSGIISELGWEIPWDQNRQLQLIAK